MQQITLKLIVRTKQYEIPFKFRKILDIKNDIFCNYLLIQITNIMTFQVFQKTISCYL